MSKEPTVTITIRESLFNDVLKLAKIFEKGAIELSQDIEDGKMPPKDVHLLILKNLHTFAILTKEAMVKNSSK
jgi:hypothetical protein